MEVACFPNDLSLDLVVVHVDGGFDEHDGGRSSAAHHDTLGNQGVAHRTCVVFDGLGIAPQARF